MKYIITIGHNVPLGDVVRLGRFSRLGKARERSALLDWAGKNKLALKISA